MIETKDIPALICNTCVFDLWNACKLRHRCITADDYFRSKISNIERRRKSGSSQEDQEGILINPECLQINLHVKSEAFELEDNISEVGEKSDAFLSENKIKAADSSTSGLQKKKYKRKP